MNIDRDSPPVVELQPYPGGHSPTTESVPVPYNQPDLAPPPCPAYSVSPHTGYDGDVAASDNIQMQILSQPTAEQQDYAAAGRGQQPYPAPPPYTAVSEPQTGYEAGNIAGSGGRQYAYASQRKAPLPEKQASACRKKKGATSAGDQWVHIPDEFFDEDALERYDDGPQPTINFDPIPGYESIVNYDTVFDIPPPPYEPPSEESRPTESFVTPDMLTEKVVRDALLNFFDVECCYDSRPIKQMTINRVKPSCGLHYQLETFTEARYTKWVHRPYYRGDVDGPQSGRAPLPWEVDCQPPEMFKDHQMEVIVPHSSYVRYCFKCVGSCKRRLDCDKCKGKGKMRCGKCDGRGSIPWDRIRGSNLSGQRCHSCLGSGKKKCSTCSGSRKLKVTCHKCTGTGRLLHHLQLYVTFTNHLSDFILEESDLPSQLIRDVSGQVIFEQSLPRVWPITQYTEPRINERSIHVVNQHHQTWPKERILKERQILRSVPVLEVAYHWRHTGSRLFVYGFEHKVYAPYFPNEGHRWRCNVS